MLRRSLLSSLVVVTMLLAFWNGANAMEVNGPRPEGLEEDRRLRGVSRAGTEYACVQGWGVFDGPVDAAAIGHMADWGIDTVRIPLNESCWTDTAGAPPEFSGGAYRRAIGDYVDRLRGAGMTVVLDLHWSAVTGAATGQDRMANRRRSVAFWADVARAFSDREDVLFEVYNEPHSIGWECWRDGCGEWAGMQDLVDAIRATGARNPIIATGLEWGNDLRGWLQHRPRDPLNSVAAGFHAYDFNRCNTAECWEREVAPVAAEVPVVITELGTSDCTGEWAETLMTWADRHDVSYLAWSWNEWDCSGGPALIEDYDGTPTGYGRAVRRHFLSARSGTFVDDDGSVHEGNIETMAALGVTRGCNPPTNDRFCPRRGLSRQEGAAFFTRMFGLEAPPTDSFVDDDDSLFAAEIEAVAEAGITRGCNPPANTRFCGDHPITRGQWASFMARALDLEAPRSPRTFIDTGDSVHRFDIERLAQSDLAFGCDPPDNDRYCPDEIVTRQEAASFFARVVEHPDG